MRFGGHLVPSPSGRLRVNTGGGQLLEDRFLLVVLTSFVHAEASSRAALLFPLGFALLSRLNWLLLSMRLSVPGLLVGGDYG